MNDPRWHHISHYSDAALRRMAANPRDLRNLSAQKELDRRAEEKKR
jgi:hypothetical protein